MNNHVDDLKRNLHFINKKFLEIFNFAKYDKAVTYGSDNIKYLLENKLSKPF